MRPTSAPLPFTLSPELRQDPLLPWLLAHADPDLWAPRVPLAVIERCQRAPGARRHTLLALWIGVRRLLLLYRAVGRDTFSVRDIAAIAGVSRSRLCGAGGFLQELADLGLIAAQPPEGPELPGQRFQGRTRYQIDMAALEAESLALLRGMFGAGAERVPRPDGAQRERLLALLGAAPDEAPLVPGEPAPVPGEPAPVPGGPAAAPGEAPWGAGDDPMGAGMVPRGAVAMGGVGSEGQGEGGEGPALSRTETIALIHDALEQALGPAVERLLGGLAERQGGGAAREAPAEPIPAAPVDEPALSVGPIGAWQLYRGGAPDPLELHRLALLPQRFDGPSGGFGAYWLTRAILLLSERAAPVSPAYVRGLLERMQRAGQWTTAQLEAPPEEACPAADRQHPAPARRGPAVAAPGPRQAPVAAPPPPPAAPQHPTLATFYRHARRRAPGLRLVPEQERRLVERVRDQQLWETVCGNWDAEGHKFSVSDNVLDRYCTMEARAAAGKPQDADGLSKLEREIHELAWLSEGEKAAHCAAMMAFPVDDRRRYISDLRLQAARPQGG